MKTCSWKFVLFAGLVLSSCTATASIFAPDGVPFVVAEKPWVATGLGNHRAVVRIPDGPTGRVARAVLKWRRTDPQPEIKKVLVAAAPTGTFVPHVFAVSVTAETGIIDFEPLPGVTEYYIYYLPYRERTGSHEGRGQPNWNDYFKPDYSASAAWHKSLSLGTDPQQPGSVPTKIQGSVPTKTALTVGAVPTKASQVSGSVPTKFAGSVPIFETKNSMAVCEILRYESRTAFEAWTPMGLRATREETARLRKAHPENPVVFVEDRMHPIHPADWLPAKWGQSPEVAGSVPMAQRSVPGVAGSVPMAKGAVPEVMGSVPKTTGSVPRKAVRFAGTALRDEYYVWQVAVWTPGGAVQSVEMTFSDLVSAEHHRLKRETITCLNTDGVRFDGSTFHRPIAVPANRLQPLWCGVMVPRDAVPGVYRGVAMLTVDGGQTRPIALELTVKADIVRDHGDSELWRMSRLRWLNSRIGEGDTPVQPYRALTYDPTARQITASEKTVTLDSFGLPSSIAVNGHEVLRTPIRFVVETTNSDVKFEIKDLSFDWITESNHLSVNPLVGTGPAKLVGTDPGSQGQSVGTDPGKLGTDPGKLGTDPAKLVGTDPGSQGQSVGTDPGKSGTDPGSRGKTMGTGPGKAGGVRGSVGWRGQAKRDGLTFTLTGRMEFDGFLRYTIDVVPDTACTVKDVRLETDYTDAACAYFMGCGYRGRDGGVRPKQYTWNWQGPYDSYWTGGACAGLHVEFRGGSYHGPLIADRSYHATPAPTWANGGRGRVVVDGSRVVARSGTIDLPKAGRAWSFDLQITPVKPLNEKLQFSQRYYHADPAGFEQGAALGANIANIHHAQTLNPVINYPFVVQEPLKEFIRAHHAKGRKVKLYYTIRELSNHVAELQALRSLGNEIIASGNGHGAPWLWEHMGEGYKPAWYVRLNTPGAESDGLVDAAFVLSPHSRWINYYLEGLRWMFENYAIDGIYMDDVAFDRTVMKRMRRIIEQYRPGALVDLHSNTGYSRGPMNQYTDFFPYVDRLWFGESFRYNDLTPDAWFVTFSGIPFGLMSEMLQGGGNPWLGAVYGATRRLNGVTNCANPTEIWKAWQTFGIADAKMAGYWEAKPAIVTDAPKVKATAFIRKDRTLVALGNFGTVAECVKLTIDWERLGLDPARTVLEAPDIPGFQSARTFAPTDPIPVTPKRGWLLVLHP